MSEYIKMKDADLREAIEATVASYMAGRILPAPAEYVNGVVNHLIGTIIYQIQFTADKVLGVGPEEAMRNPATEIVEKEGFEE